MALYAPVITRKQIDDSHYYYIDNGNGPEYVPGVTTILHDTLPTPVALRKWIGDVGNEQADKKMNDAAERGTAIHDACEVLLRGEDLYLNQPFLNHKGGQYSFTNSDKKCIVGFVDWCNEFKPEIKSTDDIEFTVASKHGFAGTLDIFCYINDEPWIIDIKTSTGIYDSHKLQVIAYQQALYEMRGIKANVGILHLNYRTKKGYSLIDKIEINKKKLTFKDFMKVFDTYKMLNGGKIKGPPLKSVYPDVINLYDKGGELIAN